MNTITLTGNLTANPELRYTASGQAIANFTIAVNSRRFDRTQQTWVDQRPVFHRVAVFGTLAENVAESLAQGMAVTVTGEFVDNSYRPADSDQVVRSIQLRATDVAASLRWATAVITRNPREAGRVGSAGQPATGPEPTAPPAEPGTDDGTGSSTGSSTDGSTDGSTEHGAEATTAARRAGGRPAGVRRGPQGPRRSAAA